MTVLELLDKLKQVSNKTLPIKLAGERLDLLKVVPNDQNVELHFGRGKYINALELGRLLLTCPNKSICLVGSHKYYNVLFGVFDDVIYV